MNRLFDPECHRQEAKELRGRGRKENGRAWREGEEEGGRGIQDGPGGRAGAPGRPLPVPTHQGMLNNLVAAVYHHSQGSSENGVPATLPTRGG